MSVVLTADMATVGHPQGDMRARRARAADTSLRLRDGGGTAGLAPTPAPTPSTPGLASCFAPRVCRRFQGPTFANKRPVLSCVSSKNSILYELIKSWTRPGLQAAQPGEQARGSGEGSSLPPTSSQQVWKTLPAPAMPVPPPRPSPLRLPGGPSERGRGAEGCLGGGPGMGEGGPSRLLCSCGTSDSVLASSPSSVFAGSVGPFTCYSSAMQSSSSVLTGHGAARVAGRRQGGCRGYWSLQTAHHVCPSLPVGGHSVSRRPGPRHVPRPGPAVCLPGTPGNHAPQCGR